MKNTLLSAILILLLSTSLNAQKIWTGTGFALNSGYLVTNWHVAEGAQTIYIYGVRGDFTKKYIADVVAKDETNDLAILKISGNGFPGFGTIPYKVRTTTAEVAEDVWVLGFPMTPIMGDEVKYTDGRINSLTGCLGDASTYQISASVSHGSSGGPVFDNYGNLIGIISSGLDVDVAQNVFYAIKTSFLKNLVETMRVTNVMPENSQMGNYTKRQDKYKVARNFVFYIECYDRKMTIDDVANRPSYINVSPTSISFSEKQESKTLTVSTNAQSWAVTSKPDWCTVTNKTATTITINVSINNSKESRKGMIILGTSDGKNVSISVTQSREYVDLGLLSGTLWKDMNEDGYYTYDQAASKFGNKLPTKEQLEELKKSCNWTWIGDGYNVTGPNGNSIVLPVTGNRRCDGRVDNMGFGGSYWTSTPNGSDFAWYLYIYTGGVNIFGDNRWCNELSVRLVKD